jgi:hypothetical protein
MTTEKSLREQLEEAYTDVTTAEDPAENEISDVSDVVEEGPARDEAGKFTKKEEPAGTPELNPQEHEVVAPALEAPQAWTGPMKEKWSTLAPDVQAEILRRENDIHKMVTSKEGELRLGREMKDVINPYMPIIAAEGGNPVTAVQSLLNTAYQLRTGTPQQKVALIHQIAETYGVDLGQAGNQQAAPDNYIQSLHNEIAQLKQTLNPDAIMSRLQEKQESDRIQAEVNAFAANPANKHYEQVKAFMAPLLASGQAKDLQEAYDMACYANPQIRSTLLQEQDAERQAKRKAELTAKKQAAVSVTGSPSANAGNAKSPERTLREELQANLAAITGSKI